MVEFKSFEEIKDLDEVIFLVNQLEGCCSGFGLFESDYEEFTTCLGRLLELVEKEGEE